VRHPRRPPDRRPLRRPLRARRRLRAGAVQLLGAAAGVAAGLTLPTSGVGPAVDGSRLVEPLVTLGIGVVGLVSVVYSLLFGVVQWSSDAFSPRLGLFRDDPLVWRTFAFSIGVFVFCTVAAVTGGGEPRVSVLVPGAAILGVLVAVALIRRLQGLAFLSIQLAFVLDEVVTRGLRVVDRRYPPAADTARPGQGAPSPDLPPARRTVAWSGRPGVVQQLDLRRLVADAARADAVVAFRVAVGDRLHVGAALATVHGGDLGDDAVRRAVVRGTERTLDQDPMLAFRLLADIGLRALSPAVNDPATAVESLDATGDLLRHLATRDLDRTDVLDDDGALRARLVVPTWEDYVRTGVADLLPAAAASPMVLGRIGLLLDQLTPLVPPSHRAVLVRLGDDVRSRS